MQLITRKNRTTMAPGQSAVTVILTTLQCGAVARLELNSAMLAESIPAFAEETGLSRSSEAELNLAQNMLRLILPILKLLLRGTSSYRYHKPIQPIIHESFFNN